MLPDRCRNICFTASCDTYRKPASVVDTKVLKSSVVYSVKGFGIKTPALLISTSIRPNRDTAVSAIFAAVRGSPMSPSTSATFAAAANGFALVMFREFATTLYPRSRNDWAAAAPIPCEAPVTMTVFCWLTTSASLAVEIVQVVPANYSHARLIPRREAPYWLHADSRSVRQFTWEVRSR